MSVVVDASVIVAALTDTGARGIWAEDILGEGGLHAPELLRAEVTNILRRLERAEQISTAVANAAFEDLTDLQLELFTFDPFAHRIWELRHTVTSYDAWYVAVAEVLKMPLATLDEKLTRSPGVRCRFLVPRGK